MTTVAGVIDTTYTGFGGAITYYVPKNTVDVVIDFSGLGGDLKTDRVGTLVYDLLISKNNVTSVSAHNFIGSLNVSETGGLTNVVAPKSIAVYAQVCALTAKSIGDILYQAYSDNRAHVVFNFTGGTNAINTAISGYLTDTYGVDLFAVETALVANGGTVTYRT